MIGHRIHCDDFTNGYFDGAVARILELQRPTGAIPWYDNGVLDPWNHVEAAMGLTVVGKFKEARLAYQFLADTQLDDGAWWSQYGAAVPLDDHKYSGNGEEERRLKDTNMTAYAATGIWHYYRITGDKSFLQRFWPVVHRAVTFVLAHQSAYGEIRWAAKGPDTQEEDALITGCASIYKSLECAILIATELGEPHAAWARARAALGRAIREMPQRFDRTWAPKDGYSMDCLECAILIATELGEPHAAWARARAALGRAIREMPQRFDRTWAPKDGYSMDWYYPVLSGVITGEDAKARLTSKWDVFVEPGKGCLCVDDQPWVTIAECCELALAVLRTGQEELAHELFAWQHQWRDEDGAYWMGYQFAEEVAWPVEKPAWTAAAAILAADALTGYSNASDLFIQTFVEEPALDPAQDT